MQHRGIANEFARTATGSGDRILCRKFARSRVNFCSMRHRVSDSVSARRQLAVQMQDVIRILDSARCYLAAIRMTLRVHWVFPLICAACSSTKTPSPAPVASNAAATHHPVNLKPLAFNVAIPNVADAPYPDPASLHVNDGDPDSQLPPRCMAGEMISCEAMMLGEKHPMWPRRKLAELAQAAFQGCSAGNNWKACDALAQFYGEPAGDGQILDDDPESVVTLRRLGCDEKYAPACTALGYHQFLGIGTNRDVIASVATLTLACDGNDAEGCEQLAISYAHDQPGVPRDETKSDAFRKRACTLGLATSCAPK